jgi:hypothetical protein
MMHRRLLVILPVFAACVAMLSCGDKREQPSPVQQPLFTPPAFTPEFDGDIAMAYLIQQTDFGPRNPGSEAHSACRDFLFNHFSSLGWQVSLQSFSMPGYDGEVLELHNIIARYKPDARDRILFTAHWDSRPMSDMETDEALRDLPIPGANDGASGVAVLMHLADVITAHSPRAGVDIVLFDGEDYGKEGDNSMYCLGSKYFSTSMPLQPRPRFGVLLDLVGDREAVFPREGYSERYAKDILDLFWSRAAALGLKQFVHTRHNPILDDHVPLNTVAGIRTINIIDAELVGHATDSERRKYWHTQRDTAEQCSAETLAAVGGLLLHVLFGLSVSE